MPIHISFHEIPFYIENPVLSDSDADDEQLSLFYFGFESSLSLQVDGLELASTEHGNLLDGTLIEFATGLERTLRDCLASGESLFETLVPGWKGLRLTRVSSGNGLRLTNLSTGAEAVVDVQDMELAVAQFADDVRAFVLARFPQLANNRETGAWLRGDRRDTVQPATDSQD